jgi:hypothetical protein
MWITGIIDFFRENTLVNTPFMAVINVDKDVDKTIVDKY